MHSLEASLLTVIALLVCCNTSTSEEIPINDPSRPEMGHIARLPRNEGHDLYRQYFRIFLMDELAEEDGLKRLYQNDWRNFSPTNNQCVKYLKSFIDDNYKLRELLDLIFLDSCLGYLFDDHQYRWTDQTNPAGKAMMESLVRDENLKRIYSGTKLEQLNFRGTKFFVELFEDTLSMPSRKSMACNTKIRVLTTYAQGRHFLGKPEEDTYVDLLSDAAKRIGQECFERLAKEMSEGSDFFILSSHTLPDPRNLLPSPARKQLVKYNWPKKLLNVLQTSMGLSSSAEIDFDQLQLFAHQLKESDPQAQKQLISNLQKYVDSQHVPVTQAGYQKLKNSLCRDYVTDVSEIWIELLKYRDLFGDIERLLYQNPENCPTSKIRTMYLTTFMCRYINLTYATTSLSGYVIMFPEDLAQIMRIWPMSAPSQKST